MTGIGTTVQRARRAALAPGILVALLVAAAPASAAITVNTFKDETVSGDGTCSLREAILAAGAGSGPDCSGVAVSGTTTISLQAGAYHLTQGSKLTIFGSTAIQGASATDPSQTAINADGHSRVMEIFGTASLAGVTITGGRTHDGGPGPAGPPGVAGGTGNAGGSGAGIFNAGTLTLTHVAITGNATGFGGNGGDGGSSATPGAGGNGGNGGSGGGLENEGTATLTEVDITGNSTGDGGAGGGGGYAPTAPAVGGVGGSGGVGAGINDGSGNLTITDSTIAANTTGKGGAGGNAGSFLNTGGTGAIGGAGGVGGSGAGINDDLGALTATGTTIAGNTTGFGGTGGVGGAPALANPGNGGTGGQGGNGGPGAALEFQAFAGATLTNLTITGNTTGDGGTGGPGGGTFGSSQAAGNGGAGGTGGIGGGIDSVFGHLTLVNTTVSSNTAGGAGGGGGGGRGFAFMGSGTAANGNPGAAGIAGTGGAISFESPGSGNAVTEQNTLVASNSPQNCAGSAVTDGGFNLSFPDNSCPGAGGDPKLGALAANGGPTQTEAVGAGSAALDKVPSTGAGCPSTDQRGLARPQGPGCEIGAYEYAPLTCQAVAASTGAGQPVVVKLNCADPLGIALAYATDAGPAHGALAGLNAGTGAVTYTPAAGFSGSDTFTYHASNGNGSAAPQTVTVTVTPASTGGTGGKAPALSQLRLTNRRFRVGSRPTAIRAATKVTGSKAPRGTTILFTLSSTAIVRIAITASLSGLRRGHSCVAPTAALRRTHAKSCQAQVRRHAHPRQHGRRRRRDRIQRTVRLSPACARQLHSGGRRDELRRELRTGHRTFQCGVLRPGASSAHAIGSFASFGSWELFITWRARFTCSV